MLKPVMESQSFYIQDVRTWHSNARQILAFEWLNWHSNGNSTKGQKEKEKRETKDLSGGGHTGSFPMCDLPYTLTHKCNTHTLTHKEKRERKRERREREEEMERRSEGRGRKRELREFTSSQEKTVVELGILVSPTLTCIYVYVCNVGQFYRVL